MLFRQAKGCGFCNRMCRGGPWPPTGTIRIPRAAEGRPYMEVKNSGFTFYYGEAERI